MQNQTPPANMDAHRSRTCVAMQRQLADEQKLITQLESLNNALTQSLQKAGIDGLSIQQSKTLNEMAAQLASEATRIRSNRKKVFAMVNFGRDPGAASLTLRQFIRTVDQNNRTKLETARLEILDQLTEIHANMLGNQAVMFYSYSFNKKMVSGLLGSDMDEKQYGVDGQAAGIGPGNIYRKAC